MGGPSGRDWVRRLAVALMAVIAAAAVRRVLRPKPAPAWDWCPDLVFRRLAQRRAAEEVGSRRP